MAAGQLKLLAVASPARLASRPDFRPWPKHFRICAHRDGLSWLRRQARRPSIVQKLSDDLRAVLALPEVKQRFDALSVSTRSMSPQELSDFIRSEQTIVEARDQASRSRAT